MKSRKQRSSLHVVLTSDKLVLHKYLDRPSRDCKSDFRILGDTAIV